MRRGYQFIIAVAIGAPLGLLVLVAGTLALVPMAIAVAWTRVGPARRFVLGGLLLGMGGGSLLAFAAVQLRGCASTPTTTCSAPDLAPWLVIPVAAAVVGAALAVVDARRPTT
jgi:hypothetical protein